MPDDATLTADIDAGELRDALGEPVKFVLDKERPALDKHGRHFISLSPFLCIGTADAEGHQDVSPRGDPPGFVKVLDDRTLVIPERPGNRRADTMLNVIANPDVGILFMVPGVEETLRINGRARVTRDGGLLSGMEVRGKAPAFGIVVEIETVFFHCAKAIVRSKLWEPETAIERKEFPTLGNITRDQQDPGGDLEPHEKRIAENYKTTLY